MGELMRRTWPFVLPALLPTLALLQLPLTGRRGHVLWALLLGAVAGLFVVDVAVFDHGESYTLEVVTMLGRGPGGEGHAWVVDRVTAPAWHWHVVVAAWFGAVAWWAWSTRTSLPYVPRPVATVVFVFTVALAARLALEKTAAPPEVVWAVGVIAASLACMPFFGWYCGREGDSFGRLAGRWLLACVLQRVVLVAAGLVATTRALGTHLDTHTVPEVTLPGVGVVVLQQRTDAWLWTTLVPQLAFALPATFLVGLLVAALPWRLARRGAPAPVRTARS